MKIHSFETLVLYYPCDQALHMTPISSSHVKYALP